MLKGLMLKSGLVAFACSVSVCAFAVAETPKSIDVPAGALAVALDLISKQAGVELIFRPEQVAGLRTKPHVGRPAVKGLAAVAVAERLLRERQDDDPPLTLARIQAAYLAESGQTIDAGHLSVVLRKKGASRGGSLGTRSRKGRTWLPSKLAEPAWRS